MPAPRRTQSGPLPAPADKEATVREMFDRIAPRYDLVNRVMTFRQDVRWRRRAIGTFTAKPGSLALDLACGTGDFCIELERAGYRTIGVDMSSQMLAVARRRTTAELIEGDILSLPFDDAVAAAITCGFALRNVVDIPRCFAEMARVLRPGGQIAVLEVAEPDNPVVRRAHSFYFGRIVPVVGGLISGDRAAYDYLPASAAYLPAPSELLQIVRAAGFVAVRRRRLGMGAAQVITARRARTIGAAVRSSS